MISKKMKAKIAIVALTSSVALGGMSSPLGELFKMGPEKAYAFTYTNDTQTQDAVTAVTNAESTKKLTDIQTARPLVQALSNIEDKRELNDRLDKVENAYCKANNLNTPNGMSITDVQNALLAKNPSLKFNDNGYIFNTSSFQDTYTTIDGVTRHYYYLVGTYTSYVYNSSTGHYEAQYSTFEKIAYDDNFNSTGIITDYGLGIGKGVVTYNTYYSHIGMGDYYKFNQYDLTTQKLYTESNYFDYSYSNYNYQLSPTLSDDTRIVYLSGKYYSDHSGVKSITTIDRVTGAKYVTSTPIFTNNYEINNGVRLGNNEFAFVGNNANYYGQNYFQILDLRDLSVKYSLNVGYATNVDVKTFPGYVVVGTYVINPTTLQRDSVKEGELVAVQAVVTAENNPTQANVDSAKTKVNALSDTDDMKSGLLDRLQVVQDKINLQNQLLPQAQSAVTKVETTLLTDDLNIAKDLVAQLPINNTDKTSLTNRLTTATTNVTRANDARAKVDILEATPNITNYNSALSAVNLLPAGQVKTDLTARINVLVAELTITQDKTAPTSPTTAMSYVATTDSIKAQITITPGTDSSGTSLPASGIDRTEYRINGGDWTTYTSPFQLQVSGSVTVESRSIDKSGNISVVRTMTYNVTNYDAIISDIQTKIDALDTTPSVTSYYAIQNQINSLMNSPIKTTLQNELVSKKDAVALATDIVAPTSPSISFSATTGLFTLTQGTDTNNTSTISSGIAKTQFKINDGVWHDYTGSFGLEGAYGDVVVSAKTIDKAGNESVTTIKTFTVGQDITAPNPPTISVGSDQRTVTMVAGTDPYSIDTSKVINLTESFEGSPVFSYSGNWYKTTTPVADGSYSLRSASVGNYGNSTEYVNINVPSGTGNLSFKYRVSSESNYDWLTIYIDGVQVARVSGNNNTWNTLTKTLSAGNHTMQLTYTTDGSNLVGSNAGFIDLINLTCTGDTIPSSGVEKLQYKINDGEWQDYTGAFVPSVNGDVTFTVREIDYAGNVSAETTKVLTIKNDIAQQIQQSIDALNGNIGDLSTQAKIDTAQSSLNDIISQLSGMSDGTDKTSLQNQVNQIQTTITSAQNLLDAENAVKLAEQTIVQSDVDNATTIVNKLQDGTVKDGFVARIQQVQTIINDRQLVSELEVMSTTMANQTDVDNTQSLLNSVKAVVSQLQNATEKTNLLNRIANVQETIYEKQGTIYVETLEAQDDNITTYDQINQLQQQRDNALVYVEGKITNDSIKTNLVDRLNVVQDNLYNAYATLKVQDATVSASSLDTLTTSPITAKRVMFSALLTGLSADSSTNMLSPQELIANAQKTLDEAKASVNALKDSEVKTNLLAQIDSIQQKINNATASVNIKDTDAKTTSIKTYTDIDALRKECQGLYSYISSNISDSSVKTALNGKVKAIEEKLNIAYATLKVQDSEVAINQGSIDSAKEYVNSLDDEIVKQDLLNRLDYVQSVVNADSKVSNLELLLDQMNTKLINSDLSVSSLTLINSLQSQLDALVSEYNNTSYYLSGISATDKENLSNRIKDLKGRLDVIKGTDDSIQDIINTLDNNYRQGNGQEVKVKVTDDANLLSMFGVQINAEIGLDNLTWLSYNKSIATVNQEGTIDVVKNGLVKITVYNENGVFNIYLLTKK